VSFDGRFDLGAEALSMLEDVLHFVEVLIGLVDFFQFVHHECALVDDMLAGGEA
jgi:hypothetical protein